MIWSNRIRDWLASRADRRQFRFPALAQANKALLAVQQEIVDFQLVNKEMEQYKQAQSVPEKDRDRAFIPIYLAFEQFVATHPPPATQEVLTRPQVRAKVRSSLDLDQMNEAFRLLFLPDNQQVDHLLKIGAIGWLKFLLTSLGQAQLINLIRETGGATPLGLIEINDDGLSFERVHSQMRSLSKEEVLLAYQQLYQSTFKEIKNVFGDKEALELVGKTRQEISDRYGPDFVAIFESCLPPEARTTQTPATS